MKTILYLKEQTVLIMRIKAYLIFMGIYLITIVQGYAQENPVNNNKFGSIKVTMIDKETKETIPYANVVVYKNKKQVAVGTTDIDGKCKITHLEPGKYMVKGVFVGYQAAVIKNVVVGEGKTAYITLPLSDEGGAMLQEVEIVTYQVPLIDPDTKTGQTVTRELYQTLATKDLNSVAATTGGVYQSNTGSQIQVHGSRGSNTTYYVDGVKVVGNVRPEEEDFPAGTLTAGEVNDFKKWDLWLDLTKPQLEKYISDWQIQPYNRYVLQLTNEDRLPMVDAKVQLCDEHDIIIWEARTDNTGKAELWSGIYLREQKPDHITVITKSGIYNLENIKPVKKGINFLRISENCTPIKNLDVLFMIDATSSMSDEIDHIKAELKDIIKTTTTKFSNVDLRTGALYYKCPGNDYLTKESPFTKDFNVTNNFIANERIDGGGDEAVEVALNKAVNSYNWTQDSAVRILFIVLDEPPVTDTNCVRNLQSAIRMAAKKGIRIVPFVASGGTTYDLQKSMEYLMRSMALATNGTYAFLTDDSGIGSKHDKPVTDAFKVDKLNELMVRIIKQFADSRSCNQGDLSNLDNTDSLLVKKDTLLILKMDETLLAVDSISKTEEKLGNSVSVTFYPNPCHGNLNIKVNKREARIFLADMNGKYLEKWELQNNEVEPVVLADYPPGLYLIFCEYDGKATSSKLIIE